MNARYGRYASLLCVLTLSACGDREAPVSVPEPTVAAGEQRAPGEAMQESVVQVSAAVEAVDQATRMVTLRKSDGEIVTFRAGDSVRNLDQMKTGDLVTANYYESVAVSLRRPGEATPGTTAEGSTGRAALGEKPGGTSVSSVTVVATVRALDPEKQTATLETEDGQTHTVVVRDPKNFAMAMVGDLVEITYTEAVAISVEKPTPQ